MMEVGNVALPVLIPQPVQHLEGIAVTAICQPLDLMQESVSVLLCINF